MSRAFGIKLSAQAKKQANRLPQEIKRRVIKALRALAHDPHPPQAHRLAGSDYYRLRGLEKTLNAAVMTDDQGFTVKLNVVVIAGINDQEICDFARLTRDRSHLGGISAVAGL